MFRKFIEKIKEAVADKTSPFDPSALGDPVALKTAWTPLNRGGSNFRTHVLKPVAADRMEFRATAGAKIFCLFFILLGGGVALAFIFAKIQSGGRAFSLDIVVPVLIGLLFASAGLWMLRLFTRPIVFDRRQMLFWKGRKSPNEVFDRSAIAGFSELRDVHALQIISEYCRSEKNSYYSYELNLIMNHGERVNVVDHGDKKAMREDAATLGRFLDKPVWDASHG